AAFCLLWKFDWLSSILIGLTLIFSSTILVLKLLPTTALHHKRMGAYCIAILIAQDLLAIGMLVFLEAGQGSTLLEWALLPVKGSALIAAAFAAEQLILRRVMAWSSRFHETLQLLAISWCLGVAIAAEYLGLSYEIGAFIAGVALARSPLSFFLSEQLKPFRDFFLVFFFFVLGTRFDPATCSSLMIPALLLTLLMMGVKYVNFRTLFGWVGEEKKFAHETGMRLAQASEFSLILVLAEQRVGLLDERAFQLVQLVTVFSLIASSCIVVARFPSPLATNPKLKQD
ncbi:MAG TPA: cation:proton antiporter, partial [Tichowtungia sp.]|nr:cation:proton antiporter [Tichowtungia sp.]